MSEITPEAAMGDESARRVGELPSEKTFTQAELDRIVTERLERDRKSRDLKPDEVKALKNKASEAETLAEQIAEMKAELAAEKVAATRARIQAAHGLAGDDADLFLTGADEDVLTRQATRLAELLKGSQKPARPAANVREGGNPPIVGDGETSDFLRRLTGRAN